MILVSPLETATPETPRMLRSAGEMKTKSVSNRKVQLAFESAILTLLVAGAISCRGTVVGSESDRRLSHAVLENVQDSVFALESSVDGQELLPRILLRQPIKDRAGPSDHP